jgi:hypothetical protein
MKTIKSHYSFSFLSEFFNIPNKIPATKINNNSFKCVILSPSHNNNNNNKTREKKDHDRSTPPLLNPPTYTILCVCVREPGRGVFGEFVSFSGQKCGRTRSQGRVERGPRKK